VYFWDLVRSAGHLPRIGFGADRACRMMGWEAQARSFERKHGCIMSFVSGFLCAREVV